MYKDRRILGIIPARGGSKGLPRKNILPFLGKPLIVWTIEQAQEAGYIDNIIVSTDDEEIAAVSKKFGASVPFYRPKELSDDKSLTIDAVVHAIEWLELNQDFYDMIVLLQPTSPLRTSSDIKKAIEIFTEDGIANSLISITEVVQHPELMKLLNKENYLEDYQESMSLRRRRQDLSLLYIPNGALYIASKMNLLYKKDFYTKPVAYYYMDIERSIDIDSKLDFIVAECIKCTIEKNTL